ncbi:MAG: efflux RND transporter periplasmic adaptor subunit [Bacteroidales bacterium]|nr:efflux RND transporter periplasmic adaptor subunit [Lachnoclostridium sp.]MCM1383347.1 efflux RND transporter periplasmic adaptor subunit [Lachnoclostridium sp.]MCM1465012.1 efflux RND transporter periplasmic adaptor subunit [Bacteroidales bacterium]
MKKSGGLDRKTQIFLAAGIGVGIFLFAVVFLLIKSSRKETPVYKQTQVQYGRLIVGVTEDGAVDIGTVEQTFDLDMSALQRVSTTSSSGSTGNASANAGGMGGFGGVGGMEALGGNAGAAGGVPGNMFGGIFDMAGGNSFSAAGSESSLTVAKVHVTVGQSVSEGDVLYELEEESVAKLKEQLQSNVEKAKADLDAVYADQTLSRQQAQYTYESSTTYGDYADTEYATTIQSLADAVTDAKTSLQRAQESLAGYEAQLAEITDAYNDAVIALNNCIWSRDNTDVSDDPYGYVYYYQLAQDAQSSADSLKQKKEQMERNVEQASANVTVAENAYHSVVRKQASQRLSAIQTLELRKLAYSTAQETYDIAIAYLDDAAAQQESIYADAQDAWEEYSSHVSENNICAAYSGVITGVELAEGDSIRTGTVLVTLYNLEDVTMTVTVSEADMEGIHLGSVAKVNFTAYPEELFDAGVTYISDASSDSRGNVTYEVTITLKGDVSGLFQGMTGDVTFVTEETEEVLYVSRRAVITEGEDSYVKVQDEHGNIERRKVITGFTDGTYVEIKDGLSEGETVLIESKTGGTTQ